MARWRSLASAAAVLAAVAVAGFLRFDALGEPSYWLDEILGQIIARESEELPWWRWLTGFHPQHGPLYYAVQRLALVFGVDELAGRFFAGVFGAATIPLVWRAGRLAAPATPAATAAALLLALSPLHVYYSREARPYALLVFLTAAVLVAILTRAWRAAAVLLILMLYTSVAAAAPMAAIAVTAAVVAQMEREAKARRALHLTAATAGLVLLAFPLLYRVSSGPAAGAEAPFPGLDAALFDGIVRGMGVTALGAPAGGRAAYVTLALAVAGAVWLWRREPRVATAVVAMTILPAGASIAGLVAGDHFFAVRYVIGALPAYLVLAGAGAAAVGLMIASPLRRHAAVASVVAVIVTLAIAGGMATQTWDNARREAFQKLDWRGIAEAMRPHIRRGDWIIAAESWSDVSLRYYLGPMPLVAFAPMQGVGIAQIMTDNAPAAWLVTAGYSADPSIRNWMCRYPVVLTSALENFRLHYSPSLAHFLDERASAAEQRMVSAALGDHAFRLELGSSDELFLRDGWASAEPMGEEAFRWAVGRRATLAFPRGPARNRVIRFHAYPLTAPSLEPQTVTVSVNGATIGKVTLAPEWRDYTIEAPATSWRAGMNTVAFEFARANAPAELDPRMTDARELAVSFQWIAVEDAGAKPSQKAAVVPSFRIAPDHLLDARTAWRRTPTRLPAAQLDRVAVEALLARLGYEPSAVWARIERGKVHLDDVAKTVAYGTDCLDDVSFLRHAMAILVQRGPNEGERSDLLRRLRAGQSRAEIAERVVRGEDFRQKMMR